jgi:hypothetical protein
MLRRFLLFRITNVSASVFSSLFYARVFVAAVAVIVVDFEAHDDVLTAASASHSA